jgi:predicted dehydrogenase
MSKSFTRRNFIQAATVAGIGLSLPAGAVARIRTNTSAKETRVGIIGLDTSHSPAFTKVFNDPAAAPDVAGFRVVAAYPHGSKDIESSVKRIPEYTEEVKKLGVELVGSIEELLGKVDAVLLETNDGRPHLEQALPVLKARKPVFVDKPVAGSLADVLALFDAAKKYNTPIFSSSSLRYMTTAQDIAQGKVVGQVVGAEAYSPAHLEKTHPDLFWYGIHGVETLYTVMGPGCQRVVRVHTDDTDVVVGTWADGRVGTFRGARSGKSGYGGVAYGTEGIAPIGPYEGYRPLVVKIVEFFRTGKAPVPPEETIEIYTFMEAAEESKRRGGVPVTLESVLQKANKAKRKV